MIQYGDQRELLDGEPTLPQEVLLSLHVKIVLIITFTILPILIEQPEIQPVPTIMRRWMNMCFFHLMVLFLT
ncbi:hypothetical protein BC941DRAFT_440965 [Chlamydoabsidia padenii]|nr:hypothetical protein BC941DRAFT_440965 [Chlamydoabsidia padenii]